MEQAATKQSSSRVLSTRSNQCIAVKKGKIAAIVADQDNIVQIVTYEHGVDKFAQAFEKFGTWL